MDEPRQHIGISGFQFGELAVLQHFLGYFVHERKFFEYIHRRGARFHPALPRRLQIETVKKYFRELLRRIYFELAPCEIENAPLKFADFLLHMRREAVELLRIAADATRFHARP